MASLFAFNQSQTFCNSMLTTLYSDFKSLSAYSKFLSSAMRFWLHFIVTSNPCQHTASFYHQQIAKKSPLRRIINIINANQEKIAKSPERQLVFAFSHPFFIARLRADVARFLLNLVFNNEASTSASIIANTNMLWRATHAKIIWFLMLIPIRFPNFRHQFLLINKISFRFRQ